MKSKCGMVLRTLYEKIRKKLKTSDDSDIGFFLEVDLRYPYNLKEKTKIFPFCPENKVFLKDTYNDYMKKIKPKNYTKAKTLICDWTDKEIVLIQYRMLKFLVRHGMIVDEIHELISFKQSKWLEKFITFNRQKRNKAKNHFEKDFYELLNKPFYGKTMENVRNRLRL